MGKLDGGEEAMAKRVVCVWVVHIRYSELAPHLRVDDIVV